MVKIKNISVGGFRNLRRVDLDLNNIAALLAVNNFGKSNLISAIGFAFDFIIAPAKTRKAMMKWKKGIPLTPDLQEDNFFFTIEMENELDKEHHFIKYGFEFEWYGDNKGEGRIINEFIDTRVEERYKYMSFLKRKEGKYKQSRTVKSFKKINLLDEVLAIDLLEVFSDEEISRVAKVIKNINMSIYDQLDTSGFYDAPPFKQLQHNSVPQILYNLREKNQEKYCEFLDAVYDLFPEFSGVEIEYIKLDNIADKISTNVPFKISDGVYKMEIKSEYLNQALPIEMMSAGTKRIIWLLANLFSADYENIDLIVIEEIETSIHPKLIKSLLEIINDFSHSTQIIITTHSPLVAQYLKQETFYVGKCNKNGIAMFQRIKKIKRAELKKAALKSGMSVGEFLFDKISTPEKSSKILDIILEGNDE